ncbi:MAG: hypothetical protein ABSF53_00835 [Terracidiphilus sp.]|jgi:hypothetical protein
MNNRPVKRSANRPSSKPTDQSLLATISTVDTFSGTDTQRRFLEDFNMEHSGSFTTINLVAASSDPRSREHAMTGRGHQTHQISLSCVYLG